MTLLPSLSKNYEKVVYRQLYNYLKTHKLLFSSQHGFRENHSTQTAVIELNDTLKLDLDIGHTPLVFFLDLSKAFDTIDFDILLIKLKHIGVSTSAIRWFDSYLKNRKQYVSYNNVDSDFLTTQTGVPQGSILGPLLFLIYMNDLNNVSSHFKLICYADDSTLILSICFSNNHCKICNDRNKYSNGIINRELAKIFEWLCLNKLSINLKKLNI